VKSKYPIYYFLPFLACFYLGCGGGEESPNDPANGNATSGNPSGGDAKVSLAEFLPGKRIYAELEEESTPEQPAGKSSDESEGDLPPADTDGGTDEGENECDVREPETPKKRVMVLQFEKDGKFTFGMVRDGKAFEKENDLTYKVSGPKTVTVFDGGKGDGGVNFLTAHPKQGDKITFGGERRQTAAVIIKIEDASPMERENNEHSDPARNQGESTDATHNNEKSEQTDEKK